MTDLFFKRDKNNFLKIVKIWKFKRDDFIK